MRSLNVVFNLIRTHVSAKALSLLLSTCRYIRYFGVAGRAFRRIKCLYVLDISPHGMNLQRLSVDPNLGGVQCTVVYQSSIDSLDFTVAIRRLESECTDIAFPMLVIVDFPGETLIQREVTLEKNILSTFGHKLQLRRKIEPAFLDLLMNSAHYRCCLSDPLVVRLNELSSVPASILDEESLESSQLQADNSWIPSVRSNTDWCIRLYSVDTGLSEIGWNSSIESRFRQCVDLQALVPATLLTEYLFRDALFVHPWVVFVHVSDAFCRHSVFRWGRLKMTRTPAVQLQDYQSQAVQISATIDHVLNHFADSARANIVVKVLGLSEVEFQSLTSKDLPIRAYQVVRIAGEVTQPGRGLFSSSRGNDQGPSPTESVKDIEWLISLFSPNISRDYLKRIRDKAVLNRINCLSVDPHSIRVLAVFRRNYTAVFYMLTGIFIICAVFTGIGLLASYQQLQVVGRELESARLERDLLESKIATHRYDAFAIRRSLEVADLLLDHRMKLFEYLRGLSAVVSKFPDVSVEAIVWNQRPRSSTSALRTSVAQISTDGSTLGGQLDYMLNHKPLAVEPSHLQWNMVFYLAGELASPCESATFCYERYHEFVSELSGLPQAISVEQLLKPFDRYRSAAKHNFSGVDDQLDSATNHNTAFSVVVEML